MRLCRYKLDSRKEAAVYVCESSAIDDWKPFTGEGLQFLKALLVRAALFTGVWVDTYSISPREFRVQLYIPKRPRLTDAEVFRRFREFHSPPHPAMQARLERIEKMFRDNDPRLKDWVRRQESRMYDVSGFMKIIKETFSQWFNRRVGRSGPLFRERFSCTLVEPTREWVAGSCAAIDSMQQLTGQMEEQDQVVCTGFGDALRGDEVARRGIMRALEGEDWESIAAQYRELISRQCQLERPKEHHRESVEDLKEWLLEPAPIPHSGLRNPRPVISDKLLKAVVWGSLQLVARVREEYEHRRRSARARRRLGLVPLAGRDGGATVLRVARGRQKKSSD